MATRPNVLSICSGVGMLDLGLRLAVDARTICFVEREIPSAEVLAARMQDGTIEHAPIWSDLTTFDARPWRGVVDIVAGGIPCQPFSVAGLRKGNSDHRALAPELLRIVAECAPTVVFIENVPPWVAKGHARQAMQELHNLGYRIAEPLFVRASDFGAPHRRERVFVMAYREGFEGRIYPRCGRSDEAAIEPRRSRGDVAEPAHVGHERAGAARLGGSRPSNGGGFVGDTDRSRLEEREPNTKPGSLAAAWPPSPSGDWSAIDPDLYPATAEPVVRGMVDGHSSRVDRLRACGNGVVPVVVAYAFHTLLHQLRG